jgi:hypothetical protein
MGITFIAVVFIVVYHIQEVALEVKTLKQGSYTVSMLAKKNERISSWKERGVESYHFFFGNETISITSNKLFVNYYDYGAVTSGANILVEAGRVSVDAVTRNGEELSRAAILEICPIKKNKINFGGFKVVVQPGVQFPAISSHILSPKKKLVAGDVTLSLDENRLYVNNEFFALIGRAQSILVSFGEVSLIDETTSCEMKP